MKSTKKKRSPAVTAAILGGFTFILFWILLLIGSIQENNWENLNDSWVKYLITSLIISVVIYLVMFLTVKYGWAFLSWGFIGLGILIFFASAKGGIISNSITKYLENAFDVRMLASSIGIIAFGFALSKIGKDENK